MTLHMFRCDLNVRGLVARGRQQGLPLTWLDTGYLVHSALDATFGAGALRPFTVDSFDRHVRVLAYSERDGDELRAHADTFAEPSDHEAWRWDSFAIKPMPTRFHEGQALGFDTTVCPVIRSSGTSRYRKGAEVDAFLARCSREGDATDVDREAVYQEWLTARLASKGAKVVDLHLTQYERIPLLRRTQGAKRASKKVERPLTRFRGDLTVDDPERFADALRLGIGRHRSFGFGMLLLRPPA